jgi:hypothetical protein
MKAQDALDKLKKAFYSEDTLDDFEELQVFIDIMTEKNKILERKNRMLKHEIDSWKTKTSKLLFMIRELNQTYDYLETNLW